MTCDVGAGRVGSNPRPRDHEPERPLSFLCRRVAFLQVRTGAGCHVVTASATACRRSCEHFEQRHAKKSSTHHPFANLPACGEADSAVHPAGRCTAPDTGPRLGDLISSQSTAPGSRSTGTPRAATALAVVRLRTFQQQLVRAPLARALAPGGRGLRARLVGYNQDSCNWRDAPTSRNAACADVHPARAVGSSASAPGRVGAPASRLTPRPRLLRRGCAQPSIHPWNRSATTSGTSTCG